MPYRAFVLKVHGDKIRGLGEIPGEIAKSAVDTIQAQLKDGNEEGKLGSSYEWKLMDDFELDMRMKEVVEFLRANVWVEGGVTREQLLSELFTLVEAIQN